MACDGLRERGGVQNPRSRNNLVGVTEPVAQFHATAVFDMGGSWNSSPGSVRRRFLGQGGYGARRPVLCDGGSWDGGVTELVARSSATVVPGTGGVTELVARFRATVFLVVLGYMESAGVADFLHFHFVFHDRSKKNKVPPRVPRAACRGSLLGGGVTASVARH